MKPSTSSSIVAAKQLLRTEMKNRLANMKPEERRQQTNIITNKVLSSPEFQNSRRICLYLSLPEEVGTDDLLTHIFKSGKTCFIPRYTKNEMAMLRLNSLQDLQTLPLTRWNIRQPGDQEGREDALQSGGLDLILVPGLAFTKDGRRLGRGKGYYDNFLEKCDAMQNEHQAVTIGLAFKEQVLPEIPVSSHDRILHKVFYPEN